MIDRGLFDAYSTALSANADLAQAAIQSLAPELQGMTREQATAYLRGAYPAIVAEYGAYAAACAVEFYAEVRLAADIGSEYTPTVREPDDGGILVNDVKEIAAESADADSLLKSLSNKGVEQVMKRADETIWQNAKDDPARPKWALVPHAGACCWCLMIGSRGFDYASRQKASNTRHPSCKCSPVVDFDADNPKLDGYDPDALYDLWRRGEVQKEAKKLDKGIGKAWREFKKDKTEENYSKTVGEFLSGVSPLISAEYMAKPEGKEIQVAKWLSEISGKTVVHKLASSNPGARTCDIEWDGKPWEIKRGESPHATKALKRITEATRQSPNVIYDASLRYLSVNDLRKIMKRADGFEHLDNLLVMVESRFI